MSPRMWTPATSTLLRRWPGPGMPTPARSRFFDTIHTIGMAMQHRSSHLSEAARALLEDAKKEEVATRKFKRYLRPLKFMRWTLNLGTSVTAAAMVVGRVTRV